MFFHDPLKSFALRPTNYIHPITGLKLCYAQIDLSVRWISLKAKFSYPSFGFTTRLLEFSEQCLSNTGFFLGTESDLHGRVAVFLLGNAAQKHIVTGSNHRH